MFSKNTTRINGIPRFSLRNERGVALVMVLFLLSIMGALIIAILSISSSELKSARSYADGIGVRQLNQTAVNLSVGQIRLGTRQIENLPGKEVWASQPGAIRIYGDSGAFARGIKLYSDTEMTVSNEADLADDAPPKDWDEDENLFRYVDLNEPVVRRDEIYFPIADPAAFDTGIGGFDFEEDAVNGAKKTGERLDLRLPMPVEWLYVLRTGEFGTLDESGVFQGPVKPTEDNPIVGRVAFWADDESSKINVNTASEPTFWDTPRAINKKDMDYGKFQPGRNEYQRYPGHPATTGLSPVLFPELERDLTSAEKEEIYKLIPRIGEGGTTGGTRRPGSTIVTDKDRLFATIDEFIFQPNREKITTSSGVLSISPERLRMGSFFLTANSRSPELNPLGRPKVSMWPLGGNNFPRTAYDHLISFCSTAGGYLYSFQRELAWHPTHDWTAIPRNQELHAWLVRELSQNVPGAGGSFSSKLNEDLPQMVTQIFDYIRATNLDEKANVVNLNGTESGRRQYARNGQVAPIRTGSDEMGFGRFFSFSEAGFHFVCRAHGSQGQLDGQTLSDDERLIQVGFIMEPYSAAMGWPRLLNDFNIRVKGLETLEIDEIENSADPANKTMGFPTDHVYRPSGLSGSWHGRAWGGSSGIRTWVRGGYSLVSRVFKVKGDSLNFSGGDITVEVFSTNSTDPVRKVQTINLKFPEGDFPMPELVTTGTSGYRGAAPTDASFWWNLNNRYSRSRRCPHAPGDEYADPLRRWPGAGSGFKEGGVFRAEDVIRTLVPEHGDNRLVAARAEVPDTVFVPNAKYHDKTVNIDHNFADTSGTHLLYGFGNEPGLTSSVGQHTQLTPANYHYSKLPDILAGAGQYNAFGDFDNGVAQIPDGAYINRPDEGNVATKGQYAYFAWNYRSPTLVNFSPNRMVPSPGILGSLPVGIKRNLPWTTLLFRPQESHPGTTSPSDHLLMEYFWMPVVEPYAISEPLSTAGKINMNYRMAPFSYIERSTGLHGVLKSEEPLAVPNNMSKIYKLWDHATSDHPWLPNDPRGNLDPTTRADWQSAAIGGVLMRKKINIEQTLSQFEEKFDSGKLFKYPSEICDIHLVREGEVIIEKSDGTEKVEAEHLDLYRDGSFWPSHVVTGDNVRERPYTNLYPRLTTRSNIFRVHTRAQAIRKARESDPETFDPELDSIVGRYRGSSLIERFIDPTEEQPDYASAANPDLDLLDSYQFRILETKRFSP